MQTKAFLVALLALSAGAFSLLPPSDPLMADGITHPWDLGLAKRLYKDARSRLQKEMYLLNDCRENVHEELHWSEDPDASVNMSLSDQIDSIRGWIREINDQFRQTEATYKDCVKHRKNARPTRARPMTLLPTSRPTSTPAEAQRSLAYAKSEYQEARARFQNQLNMLTSCLERAGKVMNWPENPDPGNDKPVTVQIDIIWQWIKSLDDNYDKAKAAYKKCMICRTAYKSVTKYGTLCLYYGRVDHDG